MDCYLVKLGKISSFSLGEVSLTGAKLVGIPYFYLILLN